MEYEGVCFDCSLFRRSLPNQQITTQNWDFRIKYPIRLFPKLVPLLGNPEKSLSISGGNPDHPQCIPVYIEHVVRSPPEFRGDILPLHEGKIPHLKNETA